MNNVSVFILAKLKFGPIFLHEQMWCCFAFTLLRHDRLPTPIAHLVLLEGRPPELREATFRAKCLDPFAFSPHGELSRSSQLSTPLANVHLGRDLVQDVLLLVHGVEVGERVAAVIYHNVFFTRCRRGGLIQIRFYEIKGYLVL